MDSLTTDGAWSYSEWAAGRKSLCVHPRPLDGPSRSHRACPRSPVAWSSVFLPGGVSGPSRFSWSNEGARGEPADPLAKAKEQHRRVREEDTVAYGGRPLPLRLQDVSRFSIPGVTPEGIGIASGTLSFSRAFAGRFLKFVAWRFPGRGWTDALDTLNT